MASTYSPNLRLELIGTGDQQGTWGATTNTNLGTLLEEAIGGYVSVTVTDGADTTLSTNNGSADQSRNMTINLTGALTAARNVICPAIEKVYIVKNATTGGYAVTFKVSGQTGVSIPNGSTYILYVNGTDAVLATGTIAAQNANNVSITGGSISGITDLAVADGGTGASDASTARTNLGVGTMGTQNANAVAITGGSVIANASSLSIRDSDASNILTLAVGSNLTANTTLTLTTGASSNRTLDISAANVTISTAGAALIDDADASAQRTTLGLGSIATQNANNVTITGGSITGTNLGTISTQNANAVSITGGSISGITDLAVADGGTGASDAATARTNLGLGSIATQNANSVSITGGSVTGITDITVSDGGTGASSFTAYSVLLGGTTSTGPIQNVSGVGTSGQALVSNGAGAAPTWQSLQSFDVGTAIVFAQSTAPTGWTKSTTHNNKALRVVSGVASSGGNVAFTSAFTSQGVAGNIGNTTATGTVGATTLSTSQIPSHTHTVRASGTAGSAGLTGAASNANTNVGDTGGGGSHTHSFTGDAHNHTFTGTAIDLAVQYVDVIIATKD